jgi:AmmeMemoRadiSam system protein A/AmmeMemoRadiSam system protein B
MNGIVFGCAVPHPPVIVPAIGRGQEKGVAKTSEALGLLSELLDQSKPDTSIIISPHGRSFTNAMGILTANESEGGLQSWGVLGPQTHYANDLELVRLIEEESSRAGIPVVSLGEQHYELDHGVMVPLHFLGRALIGTPVIPVTFSYLTLEQHLAFGKAIQRASARSGKRVAVIASGDLSHRLIPSAPSGFDPLGKIFDEKLVSALERQDTRSILNLSPDLIERAGECGLRSFTILMGTLDGLVARARILSYEGPFGVGYLVAAFTVGEKPEPSYPAKLARQTVEMYVKTGKTPKIPSKLPDEMAEKAGVFVSLKKNGELRGCIGTFEPTTANVATEILQNAVSAAVHDPRFYPVEESELPEIEYSVDILTKPVVVKDISNLDAKRYGVIIESGMQKGLLLPDLEGVNTPEEQIEICRRKAGIGPQEPIRIYSFEVKRFR